MTESDKVLVGKVSSAYGLKGWVKVYSHTDPMEKIFSYKPWYLRTRQQNKAEAPTKFELEKSKPHNKGLVVLPKGFDDRNQSEAIVGAEIWVDRDQLAALQDGEYYWHQLEGLKVFNEQEQLLGEVSHMLETGAHDVVVLKSTNESIDDKERLIPYVEVEFITSVDLEAGSMRVKWDADY